MRRRALVLLPLGVLAAACVENTAPGNDREAALEPPAQAAEMATASAALNGVATELIYPQILTDPDLRTIPAAEGRCLFRYTRVGFPVFVYGSDSGVIKLNGKLVPLQARGDGVYEEGGVRVRVRPLDEPEAEEPFPAEFVLRLSAAPNELGFHGFSGC